MDIHIKICDDCGEKYNSDAFDKRYTTPDGDKVELCERCYEAQIHADEMDARESSLSDSDERPWPRELPS